DVLGDAAGFAGCHVGFADRVEEAGFAVIDVTHDGDDRGAGHFDHVGLVGVEHLFDGLVFQFLFIGDDVGLGAEAGGHVLHGFCVERLVNGDEEAAHEQDGDQVLGANFELLGQVLDADAFGHRDLAGDRQGLGGEVGCPAKTWRRDKALHRAFLGLGVLLATAASGSRRTTRRTRGLAGGRCACAWSAAEAGALAEAAAGAGTESAAGALAEAGARTGSAWTAGSEPAGGCARGMLWARAARELSGSTLARWALRIAARLACGSTGT